MSGTTKLSLDMATLINNCQGSDIQFKVGGGETSTLLKNTETVYDESATVTLYAHSCILSCRSRYFATMFDEEKNWKESSKGVIYKPNISPGTFQDVLYYIYTGNICTKNSENIIDLIAAADEIDLEELSIGCQNELMRTIEHIFPDQSDSGDENGSIGETFEGSTKSRISIDVALRTLIIPAWNFANIHSMSSLSQKLLAVMLPNISVIIRSPDAYTTFVNNISSEALTKIISSDNLAITERSVWDLTLDWACHQINLSKDAVEARLAGFKDDDEYDNEKLSGRAVISDTHLDLLKKTLDPLLPFVRFSLLDSDEYVLISDALNYLLPRRRYSEVNQYFVIAYRSKQLDTPRMQKTSSKIIIQSLTWKWLRENIFKTGSITGCPSSKDLKFELLFRASEHGFRARIFHQHCDNKGPTLTLVKSADGHLFGGVNFANWKSDATRAESPSNFLFAAPDGHHRKNKLIFKNTLTRYASGDGFNTTYSSYNNAISGPCFIADLYIEDLANSKESQSELPYFYDGNEASDTALAGAKHFTVSDYEVFAIS